MSADIEKQEELYSLKINSDRISYTIEGLNEAELKGLRDKIDSLLTKPKQTKRIWNPRANRHEEVEED